MPLNSARLLNAYAEKLGDQRVMDATDALAMWLGLLANEAGQISHTRTLSLLDQISEVEVALVACRRVEDAGDLIDESLVALGTPSTAPRSAPHADVDAFEIDPEMIEVFREEASELVRNIRTNLDLLVAQPQNPEALWELKRSAHTFKGAAGVVGLRRLSELAHRVEDVLERFSQADDHASKRLVALLIEAADCLGDLSRDDASADVDPRIDVLLRGLDDVSKAASSSQAGGPPTADENGQPEHPSPDVQPAARKSAIVRVSLDRLDELVRDVRELIQSRNVFEHSLAEFDDQLEECGNNLLRLKAATAKIEKRCSGNAAAGEQTEFRQIAYELAETARDATVIDASLGSVKDGFESLFEHQRDLIGLIQERLMRLRNMEFGTIGTRLQRTVRVTCEEEGKNAELVIENGALEVDTQVIDALIEPLMHLLKNAVVHGIESGETRRLLGKPECGTIVVGVRRQNGHIHLSVTDDGRGIAFETLVERAVTAEVITRDEADSMPPERLRELMFLPGLTTAEQVNLNAGRGVGMSIIQQSVEAAGGNIWFETLPQKGTTFHVLLPLPFADMRVAEERVGTRAPVGGSHVMVVDDSPSVRLTLSKLLERNGWSVATAMNGVDALNKITSMDDLPAIVLSDIEMPRMGGLELLAAMRADKSLSRIPFVFISSRPGEQDRRHALISGAAQYLTKPFDEAEVAAVVAKLAVRNEQIPTTM